MTDRSGVVDVGSVIYDERHDVFVREGTHDLRSALEVRSIVRLLDPGPRDYVLDVGAHIGAFARLCLKRGARVTAVEPEPSNLEVLAHNVAFADFDRVDVWRKALTDDPTLLAAGVATLHLRGRTHTGLHTLAYVPRPNGTITVPVRSFTVAVWELRPTVLKVDIEGGEWFCAWDLPAEVRALHVEMHMIPPSAGGRERAPLLHADLLRQGFTCVREPNFKTMWGTHPVYRR